MTPAELRAIRQARGETQAELAAALGLTGRTVRGWESGAWPIPLAIAKLLDAWALKPMKEKRK